MDLVTDGDVDLQKTVMLNSRHYSVHLTPSEALSLLAHDRPTLANKFGDTPCPGTSIPPETMMHFPLCFRFPPCFRNFFRFFGKFLTFYLFQKKQLFTYFLCIFPPTLTMMHLCITQCTYWTPLHARDEKLPKLVLCVDCVHYFPVFIVYS